MSRNNLYTTTNSPVINNLLDRVAALESRVAYLEKKASKPIYARSRSRSKKRCNYKEPSQTNPQME